MPDRSIDRLALYQFLLRRLSEGDLRALTLAPAFEEVAGLWGRGLSQQEMVLALIEYSKRTRREGDLLTLLRALYPDRYALEEASFFTDPARPATPSLTLDEAIEAHLTQRWMEQVGPLLDTYALELAGEEAPERMAPRIAHWLDPQGGFDVPGHLVLDGALCLPGQEARPVGNVRAALVALDRAVLLGEPGSGKTWTLFRLALDLAAIWRGERADPVAGREPRVPLLVRLNEFRGEQGFAAWLEGQAGGLAPFLGELRGRGQLMLLLDALNEMPRWGPGGRDLVGEVRGHLAGEGAFILTCRMKDYRDDLAALHPLAHLTLRDLTPPQIRELVGRRLGEEEGAALWEAMGGSEALLSVWAKCEAEGGGAHFWEAESWLGQEWERYDRNELQTWWEMHEGTRLIPLCRNPLTARLLADLYQGEKRLPTSRAALFAGVAGQMLDREATQATARGEEWPGHARVARGLEGIARAMQEMGGAVLGREAAQAAAGDAGVVEAALGTGILVAAGEEVRFFHQLMQEYFAARTLVAALEAGEDPAGLFGGKWWEAGAWRETVVILGEVLGEGARGANRAARWLAPVSPEVALSCLTEHGEGWTLGDLEPATRAAVVRGAQEKQEEPDPRGRAAAWRVLGRLGADTRRGVGVRADGVPDIEWVELAQGDFLIGRDEGKWANDLPARSLKLGEFWIAKYPVTNWQWQAFLESEDGYRLSMWWEGQGEDAPYPAKPVWNCGNHPRESVNWYEAMAFCRWLTTRLRHDLPVGWVVRLPTELEWERAARGEEGREFPWGNEYRSGYANLDETWYQNGYGRFYLGRTSSVGLYSQGATPEGVCDLSGNIWEWTLSKWSVPSLFDLGVHPRVIRGGSWDSVVGLGTGTSRVGQRANNQSQVIGLRVVAAPPG